MATLKWQDGLKKEDLKKDEAALQKRYRNDGNEIQTPQKQDLDALGPLDLDPTYVTFGAIASALHSPGSAFTQDGTLYRVCSWWNGMIVAVFQIQKRDIDDYGTVDLRSDAHPTRIALSVLARDG